jgi:Family of unknown function (DUF6011)
MTETGTHTARCLRCGRKLTAPASIASGYGSGCRARIRRAVPELPPGVSAAQRDQAAELIADGGVVPTSRPGVYSTVSTDGDVVYLTTAGACGCAAYTRGEGRVCYHRVAVMTINAAVFAARKAA